MIGFHPAIYNVDLTWKINGIISNKTFSRKQTTVWWSWHPPSINSTPTGCRMPAFTTPQSTRKKVDKDMLWTYWKPKRRFSWPNNEKITKRGKQPFFKWIMTDPLYIYIKKYNKKIIVIIILNHEKILLTTMLTIKILFRIN